MRRPYKRRKSNDKNIADNDGYTRSSRNIDQLNERIQRFQPIKGNTMQNIPLDRISFNNRGETTRKGRLSHTMGKN